MISNFPKFKKIDISQQDEFKKFTSQFEPYSDFNFTSLFSWNTDGSAKAAYLKENLVINLPDYITGKPVYSILGKTHIDDSISTLLKKVDSLKLVPEIVIRNIQDPKKFIVKEDEDNFDYIYSINSHAALSGKEFKSKRKKNNRFQRIFGHKLNVNRIELTEAHKETVKGIFAAWALERKKPEDEVALENSAIERLLNHSSKFELISVLMTIDGEPVGFSINEVLSKKYAVCHFHKSILKYDYIDIYFTNQVAKILDKAIPTHVNWEQDLGLPGLKELKSNYKPEYYLKKYIIKTAQK